MILMRVFDLFFFLESHAPSELNSTTLSNYVITCVNFNEVASSKYVASEATNALQRKPILTA